MKMNKNNEFVSMGAAADILGVTYDTIAKRCKEGALGRINMNPSGKKPHWKISMDSINKFLNQ